MSPPRAAAMAIRPAATLILLRDAPAGLEVLLLRRAEKAVFLGGAYVFPGGTLETADADALALERVLGRTDEEASRTLGMPGGGLAYWVAAARECFEEAGIVFACDEAGGPAAPEHIAAMADHRDAMNRGDASFAQLLARHRLALPAHEIHYFDHWITPPIRPRRFDTRFFVARAPGEQEGSHDNVETVNSLWLRPADALGRSDRQEIEIAFVTRIALDAFARFGTVDEALAHARAKGPVEANRPAVAQGREGPQIFRRGAAPYAEIRWSDPDETMEGTYDLVPGVPRRLDRLVARVIAPNPGVMTGPGTNTYLVGEDEIAVIDPGPAIDAHVAAVLAAGAGRIRWILCTHTHRDHSPAARALQAATGARVIGRPAPAVDTHDTDFAPDWMAGHDEPLRLGSLTLRALHTPGHASNHVCYLLEETKMLFTGDHVMQGSTVIINPPDGDMGAYLRSLDALLALDIAIIAPGHGYLIGSPHREIRRLVAHRLWREARVVEALESRAGATCDELVADVYADADPRLYGIAARSLLAHLRKLVAEGKVTETGGRYRSSAPERAPFRAQ